MFLPSKRIWEEMKFEAVGLWPVPINRGDEFAFVLKAPTNVIKAAYQSCLVSLTVSMTPTPIGNVLSTALIIADDPASPCIITGVHRHPEEQLALKQIFCVSQTAIFFFDELSRPVADAQCEFDQEACHTVTAVLRNSASLYNGEWTSVLSEVLDELQGLIDPSQAIPLKYNPRIVPVTVKLRQFQTNQIATIGSHEIQEFRLEDPDEGYGQEQATWHLMSDLFGENLFHSPQVMENNKSRELTDIMGFCGTGICLVESKATAVFSTDLHRSTERRAKNIQKQISKGLGQLRGAMRSVETGLPLTSKAGDPIRFPKEMGKVRQGIIMVSELSPSVDWEVVGKQVLSASQATNSLFHILDLRELRILVGVSKADPIDFMIHLMRRFRILLECKSAYIRSQLDGPPLP